MITTRTSLCRVRVRPRSQSSHRDLLTLLVNIPWFPRFVALVLWFPCFVVPLFCGSLVFWFPCFVVPSFCGSLVFWFPRFLVPLFYMYSGSFGFI